ncbi:MAG: hypothetical protein ACI97K_002738 [Glaciecola sp.]|jgi:hypothetical protein
MYHKDILQAKPCLAKQPWYKTLVYLKLESNVCLKSHVEGAKKVQQIYVDCPTGQFDNKNFKGD